MPFYPSLPPDLLAGLRAKGILQQDPSSPDFAATLANAGLQAPPQTPQAPPLTIPPMTISAPRLGAGPSDASLEGIDTRNEAVQRALSSMTPEQRQQSLASSAAGVQQALGGIEAPRKVEQPQPSTEGAVFARGPSTAGGAAESQAPAAYTKTVPAHEVSLVSPETEREFTAAETEKRAAAGQSQAAEIGANEEHADVLDRIAEQAQRMNIESEQREAKRQKAMGEQQADYDRMRREFASGKPDYNRLMHNGGFRILSGIAMALGAAGQVLGHTGSNVAAEIIGKQIDNDVKEQEAELDKKDRNVSMAAQSLQLMRERFGDARAADAAEKAKQLQAYIMAGDAEVARAQSPIYAAKWEGVKADLLAEQAKLHMQMHQWVQAATVQTGGPAGEVSDVKPEEVVQLKDGRYVTVPEKDRERVIQAQNKADSVRQAGDAVKRLASMSTADKLAHPIEWTKEYNAATKTLAAAEIEARGRGGKGIFEQFLKAAGGKTLVWTPGVAQAVTQIVAAADRSAQNEIANSAQHVVEPTLVHNPKKGLVERRYIIRGQFERPKPQGAGDQFIKKAGTE
jgi:hypothetical protein